MEQKIDQNKTENIGKKTRKLRKKAGIGQTKLVRRLHLQGISITREGLVKIERGIQHIQVDQLKAVKTTSYNV